MRRRNRWRDEFTPKVRNKMILLVGAVILFIGAIIWQQHSRAEEKKKYEAYLTQETEIQQSETNPAENGLESEEPMTEQPRSVPITNLEEYASELMGEQSNLLEQRLGEWIQEQQLEAVAASIIYVMVPASDPDCINFYVRMDDGKDSLVLLAYHQSEQLVTASTCPYTEAEIKAEVWEENGPGERDVSPEEEAKYLSNQEGMDDTGTNGTDTDDLGREN